MLLTFKPLKYVADVIAGVAGFEESGNYCYSVVQPNSFGETGDMDAPTIQRRAEQVTPQQILQEGDILVKRLNPSYVYIFSGEKTEFVASSNLVVVRPRGDCDIDTFYLGFLLEQKDILGQIEQVTGSSAAIKAISIKKLADISIPVVPIEDQRRIGEVWKLSRKRKQLLNEYITESDKLVSMLATRIIGGGNKE